MISAVNTPNIPLSLQTSGGIFHDRYIVIDYQTENEQIYHCGASSKDGGNKVTTITAVTDGEIYHPIINQLIQNPRIDTEVNSNRKRSFYNGFSTRTPGKNLKF